MAEFIDISDFGGVVTNVDVEDLPEHIAQNMENLRIRDGKLEKTFGAGQPSDVPTFALSAVNTKLTRSYVVYNVFTFISDKLGTTEHRYILVLIDSSTKQVKLFWYDPDVPAVNDHLQVEDNILYFQTASDSGYSQSDNIMVVGVKDNGNSAIANTDIYDDITYKTGNKHFINTDTATTWGGSFFATASDTGLRDQTMGGKHGTHLNVDTNASAGISSFTNIALLALNGKVLCMYSYNSGSNGRIKFTIGSTTSELNTTLYNQFKGYSTFKVVNMINFNNAIYVYYSAEAENPSTHYYNAIVKYTVQSNGTVVETGVDGHTTASTWLGGDTHNTGYFYEANTGDLYLLIPIEGLFKITTSGTVSTVSGIPANSSNHEWRGITSITNTVNGNKEYLVLGESSATNHKLHYIDLNDNSATWGNSSYNDQLHLLTKMDFGENSNKNESIIKYYERSGGDKFLQYSTHNDATVILGFADVNGSIFTTSTVIEAIKNAYRHPSGTKYLMVCTNDSGVYNSGMVHGRVYRIDASKTVVSLNDNANDTYKGWNPTCIDDVVTGATSGNQFFEHAKAYIQAYGVEYVDTSNNPRASLIRMTDIGWGSGNWAGTGTVDYGWTDLHSKYNFYEIAEDNSSTTPTIYHQTDKNPIVPTGDTVRFIPGAIGKVSNTEAKGLWLGYINRSMFNGTVPIPANWYGYVNTLNNPFKVTLAKTYKTSNVIHSGDTLKYNCTAIYDGIQESLFDKGDELVITDNNTNKAIHELEVEIANINNLNKRITGINFYRAIGNAGIYSNYQLIGHMTFVDSSNDLSSVGTLKEVSGDFFKDDIIHIKVADQAEVSSIVGLNYSEFLGNNKHAVDVSGGFDGIDNAHEGEDKLNITFLNSGTIRKMTNNQTYMVVNSNTNIANSSKYLIDAEGVQTTASALPSLPYATGVEIPFQLTSGTSSQSGVSKTFYIDDTNNEASNYIKVGDVVAIGSNSVNITITGLQHDTNTNVTLMTGTPDATDGSISNANIKIRNVASGEYIVLISRGQAITYADVAISSATNNVAHNNNTTLLKVPIVNYVQLDCDDDAGFNNTFLDDSGNFNGSSWKIKEKSYGSYSTVKQNSNGAFGGSAVGFLRIHNFATDYPNNITQNQLSGSMVFAGEKSFEIEGNSAYQSDLGGVWVKATEAVAKGSNYNFTGQLLEGFSVSTAQGSTTPGVGYKKDSNKITITCRDFRLEDLGETPVQTIYSNRVNGQYARELKGRLFLGNVVLNPEDKAEEHRDWIAYSELNEFDTIPVSNVIAFDDREGGDITGLAVLFGRLVIFKPQAIFILNVSDPAYPNGWSVVESKHNIGNVAPQGVVEVHDSIYFVYHDGIYRVTSNMVASSTATPSVMDKVSDKIDDQFLLATDKTAIKGLYDPSRQEVIYKWMEGNTQRVWAYNYVRESWRKIDMGTGVLDILAYDETGVPLNYDKTSNKIIKFDTANASVAKWKSKRFPLDLHRKRLLRYGTVQFTGTDDLTYNIYLDGATSASFTKTISADGGINRFPIKRYAKKFEVEIATASSTNALTLERLQIEME